jgi:hypothetical protein
LSIDLLLDKGFSVFFFDFTRIDHFINDPILKREEELNELICALDWVSKKYYTKKSLWLISFFATTWVGLQIVMRRPEITDYVLFSPPPKLKDFSFVVPCSAAGFILYETQIPNSVDEIVEKLLSKSDSHIETLPLSFSNATQSAPGMSKTENIAVVIGELKKYIVKRLSENDGNGKKIRRDRRRRRKKKFIPDEEKTLRLPPIKSLEFD